MFYAVCVTDSLVWEVSLLKIYFECHYVNTLIPELGCTKTYGHTSSDEKSIVDNHCYHITTKFAVSIRENQEQLSTLYWLPKRHKRPYKTRLIANSSSCTTTELSKLLTSCVTAVKYKIMWKYLRKEWYKPLLVNKNSNEVLNKFKSKGFKASKLSAYDFSHCILSYHITLLKINVLT